MSTYEVLSLVFNGIVAVTSFSALFSYVVGKIERKRTAATLVVTQIDSIESSIRELKNSTNLTETEVYQSNPLLSMNCWAENRHLLSNALGYSNVRLIEEFFSNAEEVEKVRAEICHEVMKTWEHKELVYQYMLAQEIMKSDSFNIHASKITAFDKCGIAFSAKLPKTLLEHHLANFSFISGSVAYSKLRKLSYHSK